MTLLASSLISALYSSTILKTLFFNPFFPSLTHSWTNTQLLSSVQIFLIVNSCPTKQLLSQIFSVLPFHFQMFHARSLQGLARHLTNSSTQHYSIILLIFSPAQFFPLRNSGAHSFQDMPVFVLLYNCLSPSVNVASLSPTHGFQSMEELTTNTCSQVTTASMCSWYSSHIWDF